MSMEALRLHVVGGCRALTLDRAPSQGRDANAVAEAKAKPERAPPISVIRMKLIAVSALKGPFDMTPYPS
jgi:hypothetical protein